MTSRNPNRRRRPAASRIALLTAVAAGSVVAAQAHAQYRVDNGSARDANNRVGSGGFNASASSGAFQQRVGGSAGNYIVTGNVTGGRAFRGSLGYTDPTAFRGSLGSAAFDTFYRDSIGFGTARGETAANNNYATIQPFFGPGQTVAPPSGFVRDPNRGGGFVPSPRTLVQSNDARLDFGGATNAEISQGIINNSRVIGGAGVAPGGPTVLGSGIQPFDVSAQPNTQFQLSEYTSLARQRPGLLLSPIGSDPLNSEAGMNRLRNAALGNDGVPGGVDVQNPNGQNSPGANGAMDNRLDPGMRNTAIEATRIGVPDANADVDNTDERSLLNGNTQYAELRRRLDASDRTRRLPGSDAVDRANERNAEVIARREAANGGGTQNKGATGQPAGANRPGARTGPNANDPTNGARQQPEPVPGSEPNNTRLPTDRQDTRVGGAVDPELEHANNAINRAANGAGGAGNITRRNGNETAGPATQPAVERDNLNLPRPQNAGGNAATTQPNAGGDDANAPMQIKSLAAGVKNPGIADALTRAETLMKEGKFTTAIDTFERAGTAAGNNDPIIFMGVGIAELGGSYYRRAENHIRQAFGADRALLFAKFDLRGMLGDQRLNYLVENLGETARTNANDPGPLLLLAFIYYNGGMEDRAARALSMAQERAGGKDATVRLLQQSWKLPAEPAGGGAGEELTK